MELDFSTLQPAECYKVLANLITPRPIAWITTVNQEGAVNAAPFSFFNCFGSSPPIVAFAPGNKGPGIPKDTARNIRDNREFVVNIADETLADKMVATSASLPHGESELAITGLTAAKSVSIMAPRIAEAPVSFECREWATLEIGSNRMVVGTVHHAHIRDGILDPQSLHLRTEMFLPVGRMAAPDSYCRTSNQYEIKRPQ
tara:strand:- start:686 stop:1288 length:603 start_codon:yes stop_codon:yes gene_type:complete